MPTVTPRPSHVGWAAANCAAPVSPIGMYGLLRGVRGTGRGLRRRVGRALRARVVQRDDLVQVGGDDVLDVGHRVDLADRHPHAQVVDVVLALDDGGAQRRHRRGDRAVAAGRGGDEQLHGLLVRGAGRGKQLTVVLAELVRRGLAGRCGLGRQGGQPAGNQGADRGAGGRGDGRPAAQ